MLRAGRDINQAAGWPTASAWRSRLAVDLSGKATTQRAGISLKTEAKLPAEVNGTADCYRHAARTFPFTFAVNASFSGFALLRSAYFPSRLSCAETLPIKCRRFDFCGCVRAGLEKARKGKGFAVSKLASLRTRKTQNRFPTFSLLSRQGRNGEKI